MKKVTSVVALLLASSFIWLGCEEQEPNNTVEDAAANGGYYFGGEFYPQSSYDYMSWSTGYYSNISNTGTITIGTDDSNHDTDYWIFKTAGDHPVGGTASPYIDIVIDKMVQVAGASSQNDPIWEIYVHFCTEIGVDEWEDCPEEDIEYAFPIDPPLWTMIFGLTNETIPEWRTSYSIPVGAMFTTRIVKGYYPNELLGKGNEYDYQMRVQRTPGQ